MCFHLSKDYYNELKEWMDKHERMPSSKSRDRVERRLGKWCNKIKNNCGHKQIHFYEFQKFTLLKYWSN